MSAKPSLVACWLDRSIGEANAYLPLKQRFESVSGRIVSWHYFDSGDPFTDFVNENPNVKLIAIMSGSFAKQLFSPIADRDALHGVYVFCGNKARYQPVFVDEPKVKGVFDSEDELFTKMQNDLQQEFP